MQIHETTTPFTSEWIKHYLENTSDVHSFYEYAPLREDLFSKRVIELDSIERMHVPREKLADVISSFHEPELLHSEVKRNIARLRQSNSLVIIGGHQACLLTGPLYTIYKAITIIQLAKREEERLGRPIIPVFWIAGEDHDWDEVNHVWVQGSLKPLKVRFSPSYNRSPVSEIRCNPKEIHAWINHLSQLLPDSIHKKEWVAILKEFTSTSITWTHFFAKVINHLFGKHGLLLVDAADPKLREVEKPFWEVLITRNREIQEKIQVNLYGVKQLGYPSSIPDKKNFAHLFVCRKGNRYPLYFNGVTWTAPGINKEWTSTEMLQLSSMSPESLSNNVMTRPLMQEFLFPTLAFVGGPAEITYWGLLKDVFTTCGLQMPIIYPRSQLTLVPDVIQKRMQGFGISLEDVYIRFEEMKKEWFQKRIQINTESLFAQSKQEINRIHQRLLHHLSDKLEMDLLESGQINRNKLIEHLEYLERYTDQLIFKKHTVELNQWDEIRNTVYPLYKPQERIYNLIHYWNLYGLKWVDEIVDASLLSEKGNAFSVPIS